MGQWQTGWEDQAPCSILAITWRLPPWVMARKGCTSCGWYAWLSADNSSCSSTHSMTDLICPRWANCHHYCACSFFMVCMDLCMTWRQTTVCYFPAAIGYYRRSRSLEESWVLWLPSFSFQPVGNGNLLPRSVTATPFKACSCNQPGTCCITDSP